jgi:Flp pilus assembly protein TadD
MVAPRPFLPDVRVVRERAAWELARGRHVAAIDLLEGAVVLAPEDPELRTLLGVAYARGRRFEPALGQLERALLLAPDAFGPRCALGEVYLRLGATQQAEEYLAAARARATDAAERAYVGALVKSQRVRGRRRVRPSFRLPVGGTRGRGT